jgi:hypothetical protein
MLVAVDIWFSATRRLLVQLERGQPPPPEDCRRMIRALDEARGTVEQTIALLDLREQPVTPGMRLH